MDLTLVSPYTHLNGHYWPYTLDLTNALESKLPRLTVLASRPPRYPHLVSRSKTSWHACFPWIRFILTDAYRARSWGGRPDSLARNLEFHACLKKAVRGSRPGAHIHCVESRHRILLGQVHRSPELAFSSLCVGDPPGGLSGQRLDDYRRAFDTGRLTFVVETESVRKNWEAVAGEKVVHIPAALPWTTHRAVPQKDARAALGLPAEATICLFFGTHREGKDYETAIKAAAVSSSKPFLLFVGPLISGNDPAVIAKSAGYANWESWGGYFPDDEVPAVFDAADAVVLPYCEDYTKGSAVLLQACHFKKPVIATRTGHLEEFVEMNCSGLLFGSRSESELAVCYDEIDAVKRSTPSSRPWSFETASLNFSWKSLLPRYLEIFQGRQNSEVSI